MGSISISMIGYAAYDDPAQIQQLRDAFQKIDSSNNPLQPHAKEAIELLNQIEKMKRAGLIPAPNSGIAAPVAPLPATSPKKSLPKSTPLPTSAQPSPPPKPAEKTLRQKLQEEKKPEIKRTLLRQEASAKFGIVIEKPSQDTNKDGISDDVEVLFGIDPRSKIDGPFSAVEKKLFGIAEDEDFKRIEEKCFMNLEVGVKRSVKGFTILAACPKNTEYSLIAIEANGKITTVASGTVSENNKLVLAVTKKILPGTYTFQLIPNSFLKADVMESEEPSGVSDSVQVQLVPFTKVQPVRAKKIENVEIEGLRDIKVTQTADGKIHVSGHADPFSLVVGAFKSAIFTSAMLADIEGGFFEIVSARPLEVGEHEVTLFASRYEENLESPPVVIKFSVVDKELRGSADTDGIPTVFLFIIGGIILTGVIFVFLKKKAA